MAERYYEDVEVGAVLGAIDKGAVTTAHIMRWSAAVENFHRIHYDQRFATGHDGLPDVLINGSWKQHVLVQLVKDGLGPLGWAWRLRFRYKKLDVAGDSIRGHAEVIGKQVVEGLGFLVLRVQLLDQNGGESTGGHAIGVLPLRDGPPVPYPFPDDPAFAAVTLPDE
ncbi:acyl dehydratase [Bordetella sp. BOR01]|uniref:MaoC family dehydratase n=1 Tax=Bordetella sp. BOR01 TaxID=2854779 RepID=UPI001C48BCC0|nr:acyl dehydratase [Bordetella sp. BOR01]MBV7482948.1 acyl dehydratase [Bordetella sp. BOR01]